MRLHSWLIAVAVLCPAAAHAQTTTADGVRALIRGDYATAVELLRALGEDAAQPDPIALFFMASLYHSGHGVAFNQTRACGLYLRAATTANPLSAQALALARGIHQDLPALRDECSAASVRVWVDPPAASFTLGPDHSVRIDRSGFFVGYNGTQRAARGNLGGPGWVFVSIRHTQLDVSRPTPLRRHFVEFLTWSPSTSAEQPSWMLWWSVFEIVDADAVWALGQNVLTAAQPTTPKDFAALARVDVNADGDAEWVVWGPNPRRGFIPSPGSR